MGIFTILGMFCFYAFVGVVLSVALALFANWLVQVLTGENKERETDGNT